MISGLLLFCARELTCVQFDALTEAFNSESDIDQMTPGQREALRAYLCALHGAGTEQFFLKKVGVHQNEKE